MFYLQVSCKHFLPLRQCSRKENEITTAFYGKSWKFKSRRRMKSSHRLEMFPEFKRKQQMGIIAVWVTAGCEISNWQATCSLIKNKRHSKPTRNYSYVQGCYNLWQKNSSPFFPQARATFLPVNFHLKTFVSPCLRYTSWNSSFILRNTARKNWR